MKNLKDIIQERLHINKDTGNHSYNYHPKTIDELKELVNQLIEERGNDADLNDIDTSEITDMSYMFTYSSFTGENGNISNWNVSNVKNMEYMFAGTSLEKNPPKWYKH